MEILPSAPVVDEEQVLLYIESIEDQLRAFGPRPFTELDAFNLRHLEAALRKGREHLEDARYINAVYATPRFRLTNEEAAGMLAGMSEMVPTRIKGATKDRDLTIRRKAEIALGGNPATHMPLLRLDNPDNRSTCGGCANLVRKDFGSSHVWKCVRAAQTNNDGPDMVKRWPACTLFLPRNGAPEEKPDATEQQP